MIPATPLLRHPDPTAWQPALRDCIALLVTTGARSVHCRYCLGRRLEDNAATCVTLGAQTPML